MTGKQKSDMDNKVVIKVEYKGLETHMSWKAIVKLVKLDENVYFYNITDVQTYRNTRERLSYV